MSDRLQDQERICQSEVFNKERAYLSDLYHDEVNRRAADRKHYSMLKGFCFAFIGCATAAICVQRYQINQLGEEKQTLVRDRVECTNIMNLFGVRVLPAGWVYLDEVRAVLDVKTHEPKPGTMMDATGHVITPR